MASRTCRDLSSFIRSLGKGHWTAHRQRWAMRPMTSSSFATSSAWRRGMALHCDDLRQCRASRPSVAMESSHRTADTWCCAMQQASVARHACGYPRKRDTCLQTNQIARCLPGLHAMDARDQLKQPSTVMLRGAKANDTWSAHKYAL